MLVVLPFFDNLLGLVVISFLIEVLTLLWGPAKDATVPNIVQRPRAARVRELAVAWSPRTARSRSARSCSRALAGVAKWLGDFDALDGFGFDDKESLAIWFDALTFLVSAFLISGLALAELRERRTVDGPTSTQTFRDIVDGLQLHPFAPARARRDDRPRGWAHRRWRGRSRSARCSPTTVLGGGSGSFGLLMTALGVGAAIGVITLLAFQRRRKLPYETGVHRRDRRYRRVDHRGRIGVDAHARVRSSTAAVGATAGCAYVTGFTLLQENVSRRAAGPHVRDAVHGRAAVPARRR